MNPNDFRSRGYHSDREIAAARLKEAAEKRKKAVYGKRGARWK